MGRRVAWSVMLLLLASVQSFAVTCNVRCALMGSPAKAAVTDHSMGGMEHCAGMSHARNGSASQSVEALQARAGTSCCDDVSRVKDPGAVEQIDVVLHPIDEMSVAGDIVLPALLQMHERLPAYSSTTPPSNLKSLASNLRI
jgi:hypothetical protein